MYQKKGRDCKLENGKKTIQLLMSGKIKDFEAYALQSLGNNQRLSTRATQIGYSVCAYLLTCNEDYASMCVKRIFDTKNFRFIEVFRVAEDLAKKFKKYYGNRKMKNSYLSMHPDVKEGVYDRAMQIAQISELSKKEDAFTYGINYSEFQKIYI